MKNKFYILTSFIALQSFLCSAAVAQPIDTAAPDGDSSTEAEYLRSLKLVSGSLIESKTAGGSGPSAQLSFTSEGSVASLKIAQGTDDANCDINSNAIAFCETKSWDLTLSAPFDNKNGQLLDLATLDGLASGVNTAFKYSFGRTGGVDTGSALSENAKKDIIIDKARGRCIDDIQRTDAEKIKCRTTTRFTINSQDGKFPEDADHLISEYFPGELERRDDVFKSAYSYFINFEGKIGYDDFDFIDPTDLSTQSTEKFEYSAGLSATYVTLGERQFGITAGANYQSDFKQADEAITCLNNMDEVNCVSGRPGAPERQNGLLGFTEVRHIFDGVPGVGKVGIAPRVTYNFDDDVTGINVPLYLASGNGDLSSGFQVGWRSDTDNIVAGIFVGTSLNLFEAR